MGQNAKTLRTCRPAANFLRRKDTLLISLQSGWNDWRPA
jgi:hypothetical protein